MIRLPCRPLAAALLAALAAGPLPAQEAPGAPPEKGADLRLGTGGALVLEYEGRLLLEARVQVEVERPGGPGWAALVFGPRPEVETVARGGRGEVTQELRLRLAGRPRRLRLQGILQGSPEAFPLETLGEAQRRFPCVRNAAAPSRSRRNNAVYDRRRDWLLALEGEGPVAVASLPDEEGGRRFRVAAEGTDLRLRFRPRWFGRHKNVPFFAPWTYQVRKESVAGWCSWWAYRDAFCQRDLEAVAGAMAAARLPDFGYKYLQIDDGYQGTMGPPAAWLGWNDRFPAGAGGFVRACRDRGLVPGIWFAAAFWDGEAVAARPEWFLPGPEGRPLEAPWLRFGLDPTVPEALDAFLRPTLRAFREMGFGYVKIDSLRHLLYDALDRCGDHLRRRGTTAGEAFRAWLGAARQELGPEVFLLACWGVLPEAAGLADGCRLGTDGFGPAKLQQYNSWNGVVWRNDPDHCDLLPRGGDARDARLRPALVSLAGGVLMLSDRAEVYTDPDNLEGARRAAPVLFTLPGQAYDADPVASDNLRAGSRPSQGGGVGPIDARHDRPVLPWWLLEVEAAGEPWLVAARFNFSPGETLPAQEVAFADLGLDPAATWLVHEFWSRTFLGERRGSFPAAALGPKTMACYAVRARRGVPQVLATSRHLTQGGVDLEEVAWDERRGVLAGASRVVAGDPYTITFYVPEGFRVGEARAEGQEAAWTVDGPVHRLAWTPARTGRTAWTLRCE